MNRSYTYKRSHKKNKASGFRKFMQTHTGRRIIRTKRNKKRKIL